MAGYGPLSREAGLNALHEYVGQYVGRSVPSSVGWQIAALVQELYRVGSISPAEFGLHIESLGPSIPQPLMRMYRGEKGVREMLDEYGGVGVIDLGLCSIEGQQWTREVRTGIFGLGRKTISGRDRSQYDCYAITAADIALRANQLEIRSPKTTNKALAYRGEDRHSRVVIDMAITPREDDRSLEADIWRFVRHKLQAVWYSQGEY